MILQALLSKIQRVKNILEKEVFMLEVLLGSKKRDLNHNEVQTLSNAQVPKVDNDFLTFNFQYRISLRHLKTASPKRR